MDSLGKDLLSALPRKPKTRSPTIATTQIGGPIPEKKYLATSTNTITQDRIANVDSTSHGTANRFVVYGECGIKQQLQMTHTQPRASAPSSHQKPNRSTRISKPSAVNKNKHKPHVPKKKRVPIYNEYDRLHIWKMLRKQVFGEEAKRFTQQTKGWEVGKADMALRQWLKTLKKRRQKMKLHRVKIKEEEEHRQDRVCAPYRERVQQSGRVEDCKSPGEDWVELMAQLTVDGVKDYVEMMEALSVG